ARPELPRPKRATVLPANVRTRIIVQFKSTSANRLPRRRHPDHLALKSGKVTLTQLQRGEADEGKDHGDDPEPDHHRRFLPSLLFEMVVEWGHSEDAFSGQLEGHHLNDDRQRLDDEKATDDGEHDLV